VLLGTYAGLLLANASRAPLPAWQVPLAVSVATACSFACIRCDAGRATLATALATVALTVAVLLCRVRHGS
jgi:hypothetical protein